MEIKNIDLLSSCAQGIGHSLLSQTISSERGSTTLLFWDSQGRKKRRQGWPVDGFKALEHTKPACASIRIVVAFILLLPSKMLCVFLQWLLLSASQTLEPLSARRDCWGRLFSRWFEVIYFERTNRAMLSIRSQVLRFLKCLWWWVSFFYELPKASDKPI